MKSLFLVPYPTEGASNRIRVEQYIPYLVSMGVACRIRPFVNRPFYRILYLPHRYLEKIFWFIICTANRLFDVARALGYDIIFIHREAYPFGGAVLESILRAMGKPLIFDFDDSIFLHNSSEQNIYIERLKDPGKVAKIIAMSDRVIAGNNFLKEYALKYNSNVTVIPSSIDTGRYRPLPGAGKTDHTVIGGIGSNTTKNFLYDIEDVLIRLSGRFRGLRIKVVGANFYSSRLANVINKAWRLEDEVSDVNSFDIGIMPMPDNDWTSGKCGFKALLYMACGIPVVASPVGVIKEMIHDGVDGFVAKGGEEWERKLSALIENDALRAELGRRGREGVLAGYSLDKTAPLFYRILKDAYDKR